VLIGPASSTTSIPADAIKKGGEEGNRRPRRDLATSLSTVTEVHDGLISTTPWDAAVHLAGRLDNPTDREEIPRVYALWQRIGVMTRFGREDVILEGVDGAVWGCGRP
jgi:hypothetical protein